MSIAYGNDEQAEAKNKHDEIQHLVLPSCNAALDRSAQRSPAIDRCHGGAYIFERERSTNI
jgi:hypothetical protein